jgi:hypothetical protein
MFEDELFLELEDINVGSYYRIIVIQSFYMGLLAS